MALLQSLCVISMILLVSSDITWTFETGAPVQVCETMLPLHKQDEGRGPLIPPQTSPLPYTVHLSNKQVQGGKSLEIKIDSPAKKSFKGFFVQVRNVQGTPVGSFESGPDARAINCSGEKTAVTHKNANIKTSIALKWKAPTTKGVYQVFVTIAENGGVFWVKIPVGKIQVL